MDTNELLFTALRATFVYFFLLLVVRVLGKREIGATSAFDRIVALILGEVLVLYMSSRNVLIHQLVTSPPRMIIQKGRLVQKNLQRERTRPETVQFEMRLNGEEHLKEVREARWEPKGQISVIKIESYKPAKKKDMYRFP